MDSNGDPESLQNQNAVKTIETSPNTPAAQFSVVQNVPTSTQYC